MIEKENLDAAKTGASILKDVIVIASSNPDVREAGQNVGKATLTITKAVNNLLLPIAAVNFAFDKARHYFNEKFPQDLQEAMKDVPSESIVEPKASIAGPALQGLSFCHEESSLRGMYINLIARSMDGRMSGDAHPAFVEIIRQLEATEAMILQNILERGNSPIVSILIGKRGASGISGSIPHIMNIVDIDSGVPARILNFQSMIENWTRLGLINVSYQSRYSEDHYYDWAEMRPETINTRSKFDTPTSEVKLSKGIFEITEFGRRFRNCVGMLDYGNISIDGPIRIPAIAATAESIDF